MNGSRINRNVIGARLSDPHPSQLSDLACLLEVTLRMVT